MADRYAVMGNPIAHSKSPFIHARFAEETGEALRYEAILVDVGGFAAAVEAFRRDGGRGLNVTIPFKRDAWALGAVRSERAARAGAANTLWFGPDGAVHADNTDGVGLVRDLVDNLGIDPAGRRVLLAGAGGAARGVVGPLLAARPARLVIANRTPERARALAAEFAGDGPVTGAGFAELAGQRFDLVVNATAASLAGEMPAIPAAALAPAAWCYDMMYGREETAFLRWGRAHGAAGVADGVGMLVEQAAESFRIWRGVRPRTPAVIAAVRALLAAPG